MAPAPGVGHTAPAAEGYTAPAGSIQTLGPPGQLEWPNETATQHLREALASANRLDGLPANVVGGSTAPHPEGYQAKAAALASLPALPKQPEVPLATQQPAKGEKGGGKSYKGPLGGKGAKDGSASKGHKEGKGGKDNPY